jgi:hypothetical protein
MFKLIIGDTDSGIDNRRYRVQYIVTFQSKKPEERGPLMVAQFHNPTHWCILTRDDGVLEIRALPSWELHYFCKNFAMSPKVESYIMKCGVQLKLVFASLIFNTDWWEILSILGLISTID